MADQSPIDRKLILFIDDDVPLINLGRISLERAGYDFVGASNGRDGIRCAREKAPDLIIVDYMMPGMGGREVFEEVMYSDDPSLRSIPVVMLTAKTNNRREQTELMEKGLAAYLCKPFGHHELLNVIDNVLVMSRIRERNRLLETESRQSFAATVRALVSLLSIKDNYTGEHSQMTSDLAESIALGFHLSHSQVVNVKLGALLHDIGKIGVPECILCKPSRLTFDETAIMRLHVDHGARALEGVPHLQEVRAIVKDHHEWVNGSGYPSGLRGEEIELGARIVAVADAYDAMTSDRPYRQHLPQAVAIARLRRGAGVQFDATVVEKLVECLALHDYAKTRAVDLHFLEGLNYAA